LGPRYNLNNLRYLKISLIGALFINFFDLEYI